MLKLILVIFGWGVPCDIDSPPPPGNGTDHTDHKSTLVQVIACCCQARSHYLSECWPRPLSPYGVTKTRRFNFGRPSDFHFEWHHPLHKVDKKPIIAMKLWRKLFSQRCGCWWPNAIMRCGHSRVKSRRSSVPAFVAFKHLMVLNAAI